MADFQLPSSPNDVVIGVDSDLTSYVLGPNGTFTTSSDAVEITMVATCSLSLTVNTT